MPNWPPLTTCTSASSAHARARALALYKDILRNSAAIVNMYGLDLSARQVGKRAREEFEKNRHVSDLNVIDRLLFKGRIEFEETINQWKQVTHVMRYFPQNDYEPAKPVTFLDRFYSGRD